jgi:3-isopropylmalate/(R)-2-methylmalate dehydratase small subunit
MIARPFGDIFSGNAVQNALLTAIVSEEDTAEIMAALVRQPGLEITIDLERQTILCSTRTYAFSIDAVRRTRLLNGWDDIALTETYRDRITAFAADDRIRRPWAAPRGSCQVRRLSGA